MTRPRLYLNGYIHTPAHPTATAMLVDHGAIAWVGEDQAARSLADGAVEVVDLDGAVVVPGFVDSHVHMTETGLAANTLDLSGCRSAGEVLELVDAADREDAWVLGHGWREDRWGGTGLPTAEELDRASGGRPVYLSRADVHSALVSGALAARERLAELPGWMGAGLVATHAHRKAREASRDLSAAGMAHHQETARRLALSHGIVAVAEMSAPHIGSPQDLALLARHEGPGPVVLGYWGGLLRDAREAQEVIAQLPPGFLRGLGGDLSIDGSLGSRTAHLRREYRDGGHHGTCYLSVEDVATHVAVARSVGLPAGFHIIGDAALDTALDGLDLESRRSDALGAVRGVLAPHRFEHVEMADDGQLRRMADHQVVASVQSAFHDEWGGPGGMYEQRLGAERVRSMNRFGSLVRSGLGWCLGSDAPVTPFDPWRAVAACLSHPVEAERTTARAAFNAHTRGGWRAAGLDDGLRGRLVPGAPAHFGVWEVEELMVQAPRESVAAWSTDPRARTPLLPVLGEGAAAPVCRETTVSGVVAWRR